jgi:hypothetical protein
MLDIDYYPVSPPISSFSSLRAELRLCRPGALRLCDNVTPYYNT